MVERRQDGYYQRGMRVYPAYRSSRLAREQSGSYVIDDDAEYYDMFEIDMDSLFDAGFPEEPMEFLNDEEEAAPAPSADDF